MCDLTDYLKDDELALISFALFLAYCVDTTEEGYIRTDYLAHGKGKDIQRKSGLGIVGAHALFQRVHIALAGGEGEKAALMLWRLKHTTPRFFAAAQN